MPLAAFEPVRLTAHARARCPRPQGPVTDRKRSQTRGAPSSAAQDCPPCRRKSARTPVCLQWRRALGARASCPRSRRQARMPRLPSNPRMASAVSEPVRLAAHARQDALASWVGRWVWAGVRREASLLHLLLGGPVLRVLGVLRRGGCCPWRSCLRGRRIRIRPRRCASRRIHRSRGRARWWGRLR